MRHSRRRQTSISEMFSSMISMRLENAFVLEKFTGQFYRLSDRLHRHFAAPRPDDTFPGRTECDLLQDLEYHHAGPLESRLAMADLRIGDDVFSEFPPFAFALPLRFHARRE